MPGVTHAQWPPGLVDILINSGRREAGDWWQSTDTSWSDQDQDDGSSRLSRTETSLPESSPQAPGHHGGSRPREEEEDRSQVSWVGGDAGEARVRELPHTSIADLITCTTDTPRLRLRPKCPPSDACSWDSSPRSTTTAWGRSPASRRRPRRIGKKIFQLLLSLNTPKTAMIKSKVFLQIRL